MPSYRGLCEKCRKRRGWILFYRNGDVWRKLKNKSVFVEVGADFRAHRRMEHAQWLRYKRQQIYAKGTLTADEWQMIITAQKNACAYCRRPFTSKMPPTKDHIIPLIRRGSHTAKNIVAACRSCNSRKNGRSLFSYRKRANSLVKARKSH